MKRIVWIATAIGLSALQGSALAQFTSRVAPSTGAGNFNTNQTGIPVCVKDDGTTENALGLTAGGEMGWLTVWETGPSSPCAATWNSVQTAYGTLLFPGSVTNGAASQVVVYHDADTDKSPLTGLTVTVKVNTLVVNGDTDILNKIPLGVTINKATNSDSWVLVSADHIAGQFPGPMDQTPPTHAAGAWVVGSTTGILNTTTLSANDVAPLNMAAIGFPCNWLSRIDNTVSSGPGTKICFGDGSGASCGCMNESNVGSESGCLNSVSIGGVGAMLVAKGTAGQDQTHANNPLLFNCSGVRTQPGLLFCGVNTIGGGTGLTFGDGIRCCGGSVVRIETINPPPGPEPVTVTSTLRILPAPPGTKRCYQYWYRDPT